MAGELSDADGLIRMRSPCLLRLALLVSAFALSACASTRLIDSDVRSFRSGATELAAASYQFERLPSQQADAAAQTQRENWAAPVLQRAGLTLASQAPRYTVQLGVATEQVLRNEQVSTRRWNGFPLGPVFAAPLMLLPLEPSLYRFQVQVLLRDAQSREVVYEASAQHTGPWSDQANILPAVLLAAMRDFPQGAVGPSSVKVEIGPRGMELRP
jgi:hypothetical protein